MLNTIGWNAISLLLASTLVAAVIPNNRWKLLASAAMTICPILTAYILYNSAAKTGCSGGDCIGAMIVMGLLGVAAAIVSLVCCGIFFQSIISLALKSALRAKAERRSIRLITNLTPFVILVICSIALHNCAQRPAPTLSADCDGRVVHAKIGNGRVKFPVIAEVNTRLADRRYSYHKLEMAYNSDAAKICQLADRGEIELASLDFKMTRNLEMRDPGSYGPFVDYFGFAQPKGANSVCSKARSFPSYQRLFFCDQPKQSIQDQPKQSIQPVPTADLNLSIHTGDDVMDSELKLPIKDAVKIDEHTADAALRKFHSNAEKTAIIGTRRLETYDKYRVIYDVGDKLGSQELTICSTYDRIHNYIYDRATWHCRGYIILKSGLKIRLYFRKNMNNPDRDIIINLEELNEIAKSLDNQYLI